MTTVWTEHATGPVTGLTRYGDTATVEATEVTFTERESGTVLATATDGVTTVRVTVSFLADGGFRIYPMAPQWVTDLWSATW